MERCFECEKLVVLVSRSSERQRRGDFLKLNRSPEGEPSGTYVRSHRALVCKKWKLIRKKGECLPVRIPTTKRKDVKYHGVSQRIEK